MQIQAKISGILYECGGNRGTDYPDLELVMNLDTRSGYQVLATGRVISSLIFF